MKNSGIKKSDNTTSRVSDSGVRTAAGMVAVASFIWRLIIRPSVRFNVFRGVNSAICLMGQFGELGHDVVEVLAILFFQARCERICPKM
jgi:hypothetical protein